MRLDQSLVDAAIEFVKRRFPGNVLEGAAAMYTEDGEVLVSTALEVLNESVALCHEVGAMYEAYAKDKPVTAMVCVARNGMGTFDILSPCGLCQERLWYWGGGVEVAVPQDQDSTRWRSVTLRDASPHYWRKPFMNRE